MEEKLQEVEESIEPKSTNRLVLATLLLYIGSSLALGAVGSLLGKTIPILSDTMFSYFIGQMAMLLPSLFFIKKNNVKFRKFLGVKGLHPVTILLLPVFTVGIYPVISLCSYVSLLFSNNVIEGTVNEFLTRYPVWFCVIMMALLPCLVEEIVFRGVLYQSYRSAGIIKAAICTAALFGLFHMNINQMSYAIVIGILFIVLNEATGSIISSMIVHFLINGVSVIVSSMQADMGTNAENVQTNMISLGIVILSLVILSILGLVFSTGILWLMVCLEKRKDNVKEIFRKRERKKVKIVSPTLIISILICVFMIAVMQIANM